MERNPAESETEFWWKQSNGANTESCAEIPRPGELCPACGEARLAYDGLFVLTCPHCHHVAESGVFS
jgi:hypothetical protein